MFYLYCNKHAGFEYFSPLLVKYSLYNSHNRSFYSNKVLIPALGEITLELLYIRKRFRVLEQKQIVDPLFIFTLTETIVILKLTYEWKEVIYKHSLFKSIT